MPYEVKRFHCNYCKKTYSRIKGAVDHEHICIHNPDLKACPSCIFDDYDGCFMCVKPSDVAMIRNCPKWHSEEDEWPEEYGVER